MTQTISRAADLHRNAERLRYFAERYLELAQAYAADLRRIAWQIDQEASEIEAHARPRLYLVGKDGFRRPDYEIAEPCGMYESPIGRPD